MRVPYLLCALIGLAISTESVARISEVQDQKKNLLSPDFRTVPTQYPLPNPLCICVGCCKTPLKDDTTAPSHPDIKTPKEDSEKKDSDEPKNPQ